MSSYSLPLPASVAITQNSFGSVWTGWHYSAQPPAPNPHGSPLMHSLIHLIGSCKGPACIAHPYPFLSVSVTQSSIKSHYYITSGRTTSHQVMLHHIGSHYITSGHATSHWVVLHQVGSLSCIGSHCIGSHHIGSCCIGTLSYIGSHSIGSHCIRSHCIRSHCIGSCYIGFALHFSPCHFSFCLCVPEPFPFL